MANGRFTISVNGVVLAEMENVIQTSGVDLFLDPRFGEPHEEVTILPDELIFGPALPRRENGKRTRRRHQ